MAESSERGEYLIARVREALAEDPRVAELELDVRLSGGRVVVEGGVPTEERRQAVTDLIRERFPQEELDNRVWVLEPLEPPTVEEVE